ncbi:DUF4083 family protein [Halobacillus sp. MO56]
MYLLAEGGLMVGDVIAQLLFFVILILMIVGITVFIRNFTKRNKRLERIEEKLDELLKDRNDAG